MTIQRELSLSSLPLMTNCSASGQTASRLKDDTFTVNMDHGFAGENDIRPRRFDELVRQSVPAGFDMGKSEIVAAIGKRQISWVQDLRQFAAVFSGKGFLSIFPIIILSIFVIYAPPPFMTYRLFCTNRKKASGRKPKALNLQWWTIEELNF